MAFKFKKGDRVRVANPRWERDPWNGDEGTVVKVHPTNPPLIDVSFPTDREGAAGYPGWDQFLEEALEVIE